LKKTEREMKIHLISGACGFVGRNMVKRLYRTTGDKLFIVDDLSIGTVTWRSSAKMSGSISGKAISGTCCFVSG
jgi:dTDP-D-glucose 4,6-dehydratase